MAPGPCALVRPGLVGDAVFVTELGAEPLVGPKVPVASAPATQVSQLDLLPSIRAGMGGPTTASETRSPPGKLP